MFGYNSTPEQQWEEIEQWIEAYTISDAFLDMITGYGALSINDVAKGATACVTNILNKGAQIAARFSSNWKSASLKETIKRIAGDNPTIKTTTTGKVRYINPNNGTEVVYDTTGNYFRVRSSAGQYVGEFGKAIPDNVPIIKAGKTTQTGVPKDVRKALTHFNNAD